MEAVAAVETLLSLRTTSMVLTPITRDKGKLIPTSRRAERTQIRWTARIRGTATNCVIFEQKHCRLLSRASKTTHIVEEGQALLT